MFRLAFIAVALLTLAVSASAEEFQFPKTEYSADRVIQTKEGSFQQKIHYAHGKERSEHQQDKHRLIMIVRFDKKVAWNLMPDQKMYLEVPFGDLVQKQNRADLMTEVKRVELGNEVVNGLKTTKYKVTSTDKEGTRFEGTMWSTKEGVMVKMDGTTTLKNGKSYHAIIEQRNVRFAKQNPTLFEVPAGYTKFSLGAAFGSGGGSPQDAGSGSGEGSGSGAGGVMKDVMKGIFGR